MDKEYINKNEILYQMSIGLIPQDYEWTRAYALARKLITEAPVADVEPVRHAAWRLETNEEEPNPMFKLVICSNCNSKANHTYPYCPHCGAHMDGGNKREVGFYIDPKNYNISQRLADGGK